MPMATRVASAASACERNVSVAYESANPSRTMPAPPSARRQRALQLERLGQRLDAEERQQSGGQRHEGSEPLWPRPPERREPEQAERDGDDADEEADDAEAEEALRARPVVSTAAATSCVVWIPLVLVIPTAIGSPSIQSCGTVIVRVRAAARACASRRP